MWGGSRIVGYIGGDITGENSASKERSATAKVVKACKTTIGERVLQIQSGKTPQASANEWCVDVFKLMQALHGVDDGTQKALLESMAAMGEEAQVAFAQATQGLDAAAVTAMVQNMADMSAGEQAEFVLVSAATTSCCSHTCPAFTQRCSQAAPRNCGYHNLHEARRVNYQDAQPPLLL
jgi:hypothetical protein